MSRLALFCIVLIISTAIGYVGYRTLDAAYLTPRAQLVSAINVYRGNVEIAQSDRARQSEQRGTLQTYVDRTLGQDFETVDHELLSRLNRLGEDIGLTSISTQTSERSVQQSPAAGDYFKNKKIKAERDLREEIDFAVLTGTIAGEGTYAQAIELIAAIKAEPWIKQLFFVHLTPIAQGARFRITVRLRTLFFPGQSPRETLPDDLPALDHTKLAALTATNPFALPAPPAVPTDPVRAADNNKPNAFPYEKWMMTGVVSGPDGKEVWLLEAGTGESKVLTPGEQLSDMKLVDADGDSAEFEFNGKSVHLLIGQNLGEGVGRNE